MTLCLSDSNERTSPHTGEENSQAIITTQYSFKKLIIEIYILFKSLRKFRITSFATYSYADACRNIFNTIKTSGHSSLEKYTSHFIERVVCEREWETEQRLQHICPPPTLLAITAFLSRSPGLLNRGPGEPKPLLGHGFHSRILSPTDLNFLSPWLYNNLTYTYFLRASHLYSIQPVDSQGYPPIP